MTKRQIITRTLFWFSIISLFGIRYFQQNIDSVIPLEETENQIRPNAPIEAKFKDQIQEIRKDAKTQNNISEIDYEKLTFKYIPENDDKIVLFDKGSTEIKLNSLEKLDKFVNILTTDDKVFIQGFTDNTGSNKINQDISFKRGKAVYDYCDYRLKTLNKKVYEISYIGLGESSPNVPNDSEVGRKLNRRVEITVSKNIPTSFSDSTSNPNGNGITPDIVPKAEKGFSFIEIILFMIAVITFLMQAWEFYEKRSNKA